MKTFTATEQQLNEIALRLNTLSVQGIVNAQIITGIVGVLDQIGQAPIQETKPKTDDGDASNVVPMNEKAAS